MKFVSKTFSDLRYKNVCSSEQLRRSHLKSGGKGQPGQAIKLFQALRNISFTFHF